MSLYGKVLLLASSKAAYRRELESKKKKKLVITPYYIFSYLILDYTTFPFVVFPKRLYLVTVHLHGNNSINASDDPVFPFSVYSTKTQIQFFKCDEQR